MNKIEVMRAPTYEKAYVYIELICVILFLDYLFNIYLSRVSLIFYWLLKYMGLVARKPVFRSLRITKAQISLRIRAV